MDAVLLATNWLLPLLYLAVLLKYGAAFSLRAPRTPGRHWLAAVLAVHVAYLAALGAAQGWAILAGPYAMPSVVAMAVAAVYTLIELATGDRRTGVFVLALVFVLQYTATVFYTRLGAGPGEDASGGWMRLHVIPAVLAYTALGFAGVYGLLCALVQRGLRTHRLGLLFDRLPPLETLGRMTWHALVAGFAFMTLAMASAPLLVMAQEASGQRAAVDAKVLAKIVTGVVAWAFFAVAIGGRLIRRWSAGRVAGVAAAGFLIVLVLLVVSGILS
jgi:ABC-type uncharacterized transport system permease subunit